MSRKIFFAIASLLSFFAYDVCAQTKISITQLSSCSQTGVTPSTVMIMAMVTTSGGAPSFVCYALNGVTITPATGTTPPSINFPPLTGPTFVDGEIPSGVINGVNAVFTLANTPNPLSSLHLFVGLRVAAATDYILAGNTITFVTGAIPQTGATMVADYRH